MSPRTRIRNVQLPEIPDWATTNLLRKIVAMCDSSVQQRRAIVVLIGKKAIEVDHVHEMVDDRHAMFPDRDIFLHGGNPLPDVRSTIVKTTAPYLAMVRLTG